MPKEISRRCGDTYRLVDLCEIFGERGGIGPQLCNRGFRHIVMLLAFHLTNT